MPRRGIFFCFFFCSLISSFLALLLLRGRRGRGILLFDQYRLVLAGGAGCRDLAVVQLLYEVLLNRGSALLPPLLLGPGLGLDVVDPLPKDGVAGDLVGGLEDGLAPVRCERIGLGHG